VRGKRGVLTRDKYEKSEKNEVPTIGVEPIVESLEAIWVL